MIRTPLSWRLTGPGLGNQAGVSLESLPWKWEGDYLIFDEYSSQHVLGADSITLGFSGWAGHARALLARVGDGYSGLLVVSPLMDARDVPAIGIQLFRAPCPADLQ